jgi:hypothetical protein
VPEGANVEIAHHLHERGGGNETAHRTRFEWIIEIAEAILLAIVAIATAWSGYQSARWDGRSAERYAEASRLRVEQDLAATQGGQELIFNTNTLNAWLLATTTGDAAAANLLEKRFTDNYAVAFDAWLKTDPLTSDDAPPGPMYMPQYHNRFDEKAGQLNQEASTAFEAGASARDTAEKYVRVTVFLAMVLFLIAISQRFRIKRVRIALLGVGVAFLAVAMTMLLSYPHL